ncbi:glycoside hydrolase family 43 protein [Lapidilactobacillus luobeiensis]|uniref:glycoside hydrolase family 43 protein n=1 Tax=Lapidilactobacillus luobeiensis TaxID=2950371 RepID=UPI0021C3066D|nr:glycoside hydrolase family 43 protein [Lapidilactobacillus luobeiensis]
MNQNGHIWFDDLERPIQAHGGMILESQGRYYWYGENKDASNFGHNQRQVPFVGISCYSSSDLKVWHYEGLVLNENSDLEGRINRTSVVERPKVVFNRQTQMFVMWCHFDDAAYHFAGCCVAIADCPTGPFKVVDILRPNGKESRDMTLFQNEKKAYLIHSSDMNKTIYFSELTEDYLNTTGFMTKAFVDQEREAPTIFQHDDWFFMITSGCTGWHPNPALFSRSHFLLSGQKLIDNPCQGVGRKTTYDGQPTYVLEVDQHSYLMLDHWHPDDLRSSGYSILPIETNGRDLRIPWVEIPFGGQVN